MRFLFQFFIFFAYCSSSYGALTADWSYVEKRLKKAGLDKNYIAALKSNYVHKDLQTVIKLNVLLFLKTSDYHAVQVTGTGAESIGAFLSAHKATFDKTEKDFGVSRHVIASLLWMETRHGQNYGNFHVPSAFIHLLQSDRKDVINFLQDKATDFNSKVTKKQRKEITKRTKRKADWALSELKALQTLYKKDPNKLSSLFGSFSGAFGMPQFLPSSYKTWAKTTRKKAAPDLFTADDAIYSVGFYLKEHGWKQKKTKTHVKALMRYNNSRDYAEAILRLSKMVDRP